MCGDGECAERCRALVCVHFRSMECHIPAPVTFCLRRRSPSHSPPRRWGGPAPAPLLGCSSLPAASLAPARCVLLVAPGPVCERVAQVPPRPRNCRRCRYGPCRTTCARTTAVDPIRRRRPGTPLRWQCRCGCSAEAWTLPRQAQVVAAASPKATGGTFAGPVLCWPPVRVPRISSRPWASPGRGKRLRGRPTERGLHLRATHNKSPTTHRTRSAL